MDWAGIFHPDTPLLEIFLRGSLTYLGIFFLLRVVLKRQAGAMGVTDLLVIVLVADAAQNAMAAGYKSFTDGILLVGVIVFWSYALDWLAYHFPAIDRIIKPPPLPLVVDGKLLRRNMRQELISEEELMTQFREQGIDSPSQVRKAHMESDGRISVIKYGEDGQQGSANKKRLA